MIYQATKAGFLAVTFVLFSCAAKDPPVAESIRSVKELRSEGLILQSYEKTCGAAALATLMNDLSDTQYSEAQVLRSIWSDTVPLKEYRASGQSLPPTSVQQLQTTARAFNFNVLALQSLEGKGSRNVIQNLTPFIALLHFPRGLSHYVVVRESSNNWMLIADPAFGQFRIPVKDFYHFWNEGGRVFVTISKKPFYAWKNEQGTLFVNRADTLTLPNYGPVYPASLYNGARKSITFLNSLN